MTAFVRIDPQLDRGRELGEQSRIHDQEARIGGAVVIQLVVDHRGTRTAIEFVTVEGELTRRHNPGFSADVRDVIFRRRRLQRLAPPPGVAEPIAQLAPNANGANDGNSLMSDCWQSPSREHHHPGSRSTQATFISRPSATDKFRREASNVTPVKRQYRSCLRNTLPVMARGFNDREIPRSEISAFVKFAGSSTSLTSSSAQAAFSRSVSQVTRPTVLHCCVGRNAHGGRPVSSHQLAEKI